MTEEKKEEVVPESVKAEVESGKVVETVGRNLLAGKTIRWIFHLLLMMGLDLMAFSWVKFILGFDNNYTTILGLLFALFWSVLYLYLARNKVVTIEGDKHAAIQVMLFGKILNGKTESGHSLFKFLSPGWAILLPWENLFGDAIDVNRGKYIKGLPYQAEAIDGPLDIKVAYTFRVIPSKLQRVIEISNIETEREEFIERKFDSIVSSFLKETIPQYSVSELLKNKWDEGRNKEELQGLSKNPQAEIEKEWAARFLGKSPEEKELGHMITSLILEDVNLEETTQLAAEQIQVNESYARSANIITERLGLAELIKKMRESSEKEERLVALQLTMEFLKTVQENAGKINTIRILGSDKEKGDVALAALLGKVNKDEGGAK